MPSSNINDYLRNALHHSETPPPIKVRYFYTSPIPIDDPLSPVPPPNTNQAFAAKQPPKPFSEYDNAALDKAWRALRQEISKFKSEKDETRRQRQDEERSRSRPGSSSLQYQGERASSSGSRPGTPRTRATRPHTSSLLSHVDGPASAEDTAEPLDASALNPDAVGSISDTTGNPFVRAPSRKKIDTLAQQQQQQRQDPSSRPQPQTRDTYDWEDASHLVDKPFSHTKGSGENEEDKGPATAVAVGISRLHQVEMPQLEMTPIYWTPVHDTAMVTRGTWFYADTMLPVEPQVAVMLEAGYVDLRCWSETWKDELNSAMEVGAAGEEKILHMLWPPDEDASRTRMDGTRRDNRTVASREGGQSLLGVATSNIIEDDRPQTPQEVRKKAVEAASLLIDTACGGAGQSDNKAAGSLAYGRAGALRNYVSFGVIYANAREARLLKPSLMPSAYYGRRPLANYIRKGYKLGIPVVRGFDQAVWDRLHPPKKGAKVDRAGRGVASSSSGAPPTQRASIDPDLAKADRPLVTDLIFVVHGIGQKLSQRMESFHFTHAINAFRREISLEVGNKELQARFRRDMGNIMVLPINWRHSLSFEEGGYRDGQEDPAVNEFTLNDITPHTLPSVRNIVSDVMLDIPYYMSHHQPKMIAAVVREANRVYQLWCKNNPGFAQRGRVHIIAHSLGSVMAVDILSRQPTYVPPSLSDPTNLDLKTESATSDHFLFNTHNLYLAGSPAGFFLLLKKAQLLPRIDSASAAAEADPTTNHLAVCGSRGTYGCLAVENLYNIINPYDPVAYRMNAAVDAVFAASLKQAVIPSATPGWFGVGTKGSTSALFGGSINSNGAESSNVKRNVVTTTTTTNATTPNNSISNAIQAAGISKLVEGDDIRYSSFSSTAPTTPNAAAADLPPELPRLPSNVELETHNFTRGELAEKRMRLLNDNGQIDYFLRYGGGAFEIQYLTMLSAHSSYWLLRDFVRMVVTETGRVPGRDGTFLGMRAQKVGRRKGKR